MDSQNESTISIVGSKVIALFQNHWYGLVGLAVLMVLLWLAYLGLAELVPAVAHFIVDLGSTVKSGARDIARSIHVPSFNVRRPSDLVEICIWLLVILALLKVWAGKRRR